MPGTQASSPPCRELLNGDYQKPRYVKVLLSGAPFALLNVMQKASSASPVS